LKAFDIYNKNNSKQDLIILLFLCPHFYPQSTVISFPYPLRIKELWLDILKNISENSRQIPSNIFQYPFGGFHSHKHLKIVKILSDKFWFCNHIDHFLMPFPLAST
jgi:hypothetical protein